MTAPRPISGGGTPAADAFYMPADHCRQAQLWLPWPTETKLQDAVLAVARAAADFEPVRLVVNPGAESAARKICGAAIRDVIALPHASLRLRDTGPTFLVDGKGGSAAVDWRFNGWGGRGNTDDTDLAHALLGAAEVRRFRAPLTLEGSSIVADGRGSLLALAPAVFDPARNPDLAQLEAFGILQNWLSVDRVAWLPETHPHDTLHGDVRMLAAFLESGAVAITEGDSPTNAYLARTRSAQGMPFDLVRLPAAPLMSYTNFLVLNGAVLMPAFDAATDTRAADILAGHFGRRIIPVPATLLAEANVTLTSLALPHPARLLERDRATVLPRSAWDQPTPDAEALLQKYIDMAESS